ncbi:SRPBCC family protein [Streptomyces sp. NPDC093970]|uniref:SRPBCC family protein n=1 Tax=Streptomyces sp. NPDC093970 TaxID=3155076 RepID=UPI003429F92D
MERLWKLQESIVVEAPRTEVYAALSHLRNMGKWSPECFWVWHRGTTAHAGTGFVGFNRKGPLVWFTTCRVTVAEAPHEFAFRVGTFGLPVALWGYRLEQEGGATRVTEYWQDLRTGRGARVTELLGLVFTGTRPGARAAANRAGMRTTLRRLRQAVAA